MHSENWPKNGRLVCATCGSCNSQRSAVVTCVLRSDVHLKLPPMSLTAALFPLACSTQPNQTQLNFCRAEELAKAQETLFGASGSKRSAMRKWPVSAARLGLYALSRMRTWVAVAHLYGHAHPTSDFALTVGDASSFLSLQPVVTHTLTPTLTHAHPLWPHQARVLRDFSEGGGLCVALAALLKHKKDYNM
jgi:hypothetical protein